MAGGAAVTLATKSGTNTLHGTGWWFNNNQHFNSDPVYFRPVGYVKPVSILNIFGGNIGGPIKKDKLFYFFNYERTTERTGQFGSYSVAPADFRAGDFSAWTPYSVVYDPDTASAANAVARTPFPGNRVPQARWNSVFPNIYKKRAFAEPGLAHRPAQPERQLRCRRRPESEPQPVRREG